MTLAEYPSLTARRDGSGPEPKKSSKSRQAKNADIARLMGDEDAARMLGEINARMDTKRAEMDRFQDLCYRYDNLYYPDVITRFGADHWPDDPNRKIAGRAHVSVNVYPVYVDIPAALQATVPVENIAPADPRMEPNRELAASVERVYFAWKEETGFEIKNHKAAVTKGLYGRTAAKVWWDEDTDMPQFSVIDQPRNLWLGFGSTDYTKLEWAVYAIRMHPDAIAEKYGLDIGKTNEGMPYARPNNGSHLTQTTQPGARDWLTGDDSYMVEVIDYWYRKPKNPSKMEPGKKTEMVTCNAIIVGNYMVKNDEHPEYDGMLPYVPLFNTYIPGVPDGRSEYFDIEQLVREKDERLSAGAQMIAKTVGGQFWQLTGPEAPDKVPPGVEPKADKVVAPGAGNRIEKIEPWMPQFQFNDYLDRIDRELSDVSGLNDLLRGLAPAQVLSSGKAINALVANYEARISIKRDLFYEWRRAIWELSVVVWGNKNEDLGLAFAQASRLQITPPSLTPRDELETSTMAANNVNSKLWTLRRGMDKVGVEDPEAELDILKEERTDAALFPADVQTQVALMAQMQQMQMDMQQLQAQMGGGQPGMGGEGPLDQLAAQAAGMAPDGMTSLNGPGEQGVLPPEALSAGAPPPGGPGGGIETGPGFNAASQTMVKGGEPTNRLLLQQPLGAPPEEGL